MFGSAVPLFPEPSGDRDCHVCQKKYHQHVPGNHIYHFWTGVSFRVFMGDSMLSHRLNRDELPPGQSRCLRSPQCLGPVMVPWCVKLVRSFCFFGNKKLSKNMWPCRFLGNCLDFTAVVFFLIWTFATKNCHESSAESRSWKLWRNLGLRTCGFVVPCCFTKTSSNFQNFQKR